MKTRPFGDSNIQASVIGFGAWAIGGGQVWGSRVEESDALRALSAALDAGITLIDTAPAYGWGRSEALVGQAIRGRRDQVVLATKCGLLWDDQRGSYFSEFEGKSLRRSLRPDTIQMEVENSLKRLGTDYIDLYQIHWPSAPPEKTPVSDTMAVLLKLKREGKIRAIGVSNVTVPELREYIRCGPIASCQLRYSMLYRGPENDLLPFCGEHELATLTYMSLEQGLLTGKIGMDRVFSNTEFRANDAWNPWFLPLNRQRVLDLLSEWTPLLEKYQCTLAQLVVAWTLAQRGITHVLCGARNAFQIRETALAADFSLTAADLVQMRAQLESLGPPAVNAQKIAS